MRIPPIPHRKPPPKTPVEAARRAALETGRVSADAVARNAKRDPARVPVIDPATLFSTPEARRAADREGPDYVRRLTANMVHRALEGEIRFPRDDLSIYHVADRLVAELEEPKRAAARKAARIKRVDAEIAKLRDGFWDRDGRTSVASGAGGEPGTQPARPIPADRLPKRSITSTRIVDPLASSGGGGGGLSAAGIAAAAMAAEQTRRGLIEWLLDPSRRQIDPGSFFPDVYDPTSLESTDQAAREGVGGEGGVPEVTEAAEPSGSTGLLGDDSWLASLILLGAEAMYGAAPGPDHDAESLGGHPEGPTAPVGGRVVDGVAGAPPTPRAAGPEATSPMFSDPQTPFPPRGHGSTEDEVTADQLGGDATRMEAAEPPKPIPGISFPEITDWHVLGGPDLDDRTIPASILALLAHNPDEWVELAPEIPDHIESIILEMWGSRGGPNTRRWLRAVRDGVIGIARELGLDVAHVAGSQNDQDQEVRERVVPNYNPHTGRAQRSTRGSVRSDLTFRCTNADGNEVMIDIQTTDVLADGSMTDREIYNAFRLFMRGNRQDYLIAISKRILNEETFPWVLDRLRPIIRDACGDHSSVDDEREFGPNEVHEILRQD